MPKPANATANTAKKSIFFMVIGFFAIMTTFHCLTFRYEIGKELETALQ
jgi:hypothetical protein